MIEPVTLTDVESKLAAQIKWDSKEWEQIEHADRIINFDRVGQLTESLLKRNAIPEVRLRYFTDPDMNIGGHGKSRKQRYEANGVHGPAIFRSTSFVPMLRYFIGGPDLPKHVIAGFIEVSKDMGTTGTIMDTLERFVRNDVRTRRLRGDLSGEQYFQLAHELGLPQFAEAVRSAARSAAQI